MDKGHHLDVARRMVKKKLSPFNIQVDITFHDNDMWTVSAKKQLGINVQHAVIQSFSLIEAVLNLIKEIEQNFEKWVEELKYGD